MITPWLVTVLLSAVGSAPQSEADLHRVRVGGGGTIREGFTLELGLGASYLTGDGLQQLGIAPLSVSVGWFVSNDLSLGVRATGVSYFSHGNVRLRGQRGEYTRTLVARAVELAGAQVQYWPAERVSLALLGGVAVQNPRWLGWSTDEQSPPAQRVGYGGSARAGYVVWQRENAAVLRIGVEVMPSVFDGELVLGTALLGELQIL